MKRHFFYVTLSSGNQSSWENGRPVGIESTIESGDGTRKSVIVPDPRLPPGWVKHLAQRVYGASAGKWDTIIVSPEGRRFRTRMEIKAYLDNNQDFKYSENMFNFALNSRKRKQGNSSEIVVKSEIKPEPGTSDSPPADGDDEEGIQEIASIRYPKCCVGCR